MTLLETGAVAKQLGLSTTRVCDLGAQIGVPALRGRRGRRLWTPEEVARLAAYRRERLARYAAHLAARRTARAGDAPGEATGGAPAAGARPVPPVVDWGRRYAMVPPDPDQLRRLGLDLRHLAPQVHAAPRAVYLGFVCRVCGGAVVRLGRDTALDEALRLFIADHQHPEVLD